MGNWKHFDRYGNPLWDNNSPHTNRFRLALLKCRPESKPRGGKRKTSNRKNLEVTSHR